MNARGDPRGELPVASDPEPREWVGLEQLRVTGGRVSRGDSDNPLPSDSWVGLKFERGHVRRLEIDIVNDVLSDAS